MTTAACLSVDNQPEWIQAQIVSANFFDLLGVKPVLGRTFLPDEDQGYFIVLLQAPDAASLEYASNVAARASAAWGSRARSCRMRAIGACVAGSAVGSSMWVRG